MKCGFAACLPVTRGSVAPNQHRRPFYIYNSYNRSHPEGDGQEANLDGHKEHGKEKRVHIIEYQPTHLVCKCLKIVIQPKADILRQREHRICASKACQLSENELKSDFKGNRLTLRI